MTRKIFVLALLVYAAYSTVYAQEEAAPAPLWTKKGVAALNLTQVSLKNWAAGGESAVGFDAMLNYGADYKKGRHIWNNRLELAYGMNKTDQYGSRKTNDKMYLSSSYGYEISRSLYLSAGFSFLSQFSKGYNYGVSPKAYISKFMAPAYLSVGPGLKWVPNKYLTVNLSPATWRGIFVLDDTLSHRGAFGVEPDKHILSEFGADLVAELKYDFKETNLEFLKNFSLYSRLELYSNYLEEIQNVDVRWDVLLSMKINDWFSTNLTTNLVYDNDIKFLQADGSAGPRVQFKEALGVGITVHF
ncbi:MAG: DUF3078 domain-containing protein [Culturomica sp.]|jgi:hypothetical protein|nr:DUF3078 domain-containing protein [Culturomica sp.]